MQLFINQWQADLDASLRQFAHLATRLEEVDFIYGLLGTAILWPIWEGVQDFEGESLDAVMFLVPEHGKQILKAIQSFSNDPATVVQVLGKQADENPDLRQALMILINYFQVQPTFFGYLAQEMVPKESGDKIYHVAEAIEAALVNVGGITNIQKLAITINVPYTSSVQSNKGVWLPVTAVFFTIFLAVTLGWYWWRYLSPMGDGFNIAVAPFAVTDEAEQVTADALSDWFYTGLVEEVDRLPSSQKVVTRGSDRIETIQGDDPEARYRHAAEVAARLQATILVYGVVSGAGPGHEVSLEFYVNDAGFGYGSEIAGPSRLGRPVTFTLPLDAVSLDSINARLDGRRQALQHIVVGLGHLYVNRYEQAWAELNWTLGIPEWPQTEGHEVVQLLLGATRLRAYDPLVNPKELERAQGHFAEARRINPQYARAYMGLGIVAYLQAQTIDPTSERIVAVDANRLIEAKGLFLTSVHEEDQELTAYARTKSNLGLGAVNLLGYEFGLEGWSAFDAENALNQVVQDYLDADKPDELTWLAADAHAHLAILATVRGDWEMVLAENRRAIETLQDLPHDPPAIWLARYWSRIGLAYAALERPSEARTAYCQAVELGQGRNSQLELDEWQAGCEQLAQ